jgi:HD-GYP domain-containing protein (c-di-GMP phosphodiesterase class II)
MPGVGVVTVSIGVAELARGGSVIDLYRRADEALYDAKRAGRNRTCIHRDGAAAAPAADGLSPTAALTRVLLRAIGARDPAARAHCERVAAAADRLARALSRDAEERAALVDAALVHEIGGPGAGSAPAALAGEIVAGGLSPEQAAWIRGHRERWDGAGGPDGLAGEAIPLGARILAVADAWDTLTAPQPAGEGLPAAIAAEMLRAAAGVALCPAVVAALDAAGAPPAAIPAAGA